MDETKLSPAVELLLLTWKGSYNSKLWSWARLNRCMATALHLAIEAGLDFTLDDFNYISKHFRWAYWVGDGEGVYCHAVVANNMSAIKAFEHCCNRKPFIVNGVDQTWMNMDTHRNRDRLAVGSRFRHNGTLVMVTSFDDKNGKIIACAHKPRKIDDSGYLIGVRKVEYIYKLTHKDLKA